MKVPLGSRAKSRLETDAAAEYLKMEHTLYFLYFLLEKRDHPINLSRCIFTTSKKNRERAEAAFDLPREEEEASRRKYCKLVKRSPLSFAWGIGDVLFFFSFSILY